MTDTNCTVITLDSPVPEQENPFSEGSVQFIGNATALIRCAGFTILTDPTFIHKGEKVDIGFQMHSTRLTNPAIEIEDLPPFDFILLSHWHADHFDQLAMATFDKNTTLIVTRPEAAAELMQRGFTNIRSMETWESIVFEKGSARLKLTSLPAKHGPALTGILVPEVMGSLLEFDAGPRKETYRIYITGDTIMYDGIRQIAAAFPVIDLALLHLGGATVMGVLLTMDAEQGLEWLQTVNPDRAIPVHFDDYDVFKSPLSDFTREVEVASLGNKIQYLKRGDSWRFPVKSEMVMEA